MSEEKFIFEKQGQHLLLLIILLLPVIYLYNTINSIGDVNPLWFWLALSMPIIHQLYVWITWRIELQSQSITKKFGKNGFKFYKIGFEIPFVGRLITIILLAMDNRNTIPFDTIYTQILGFVFIFPTLYLFYSVVRYFGMDRAYGIDHFDPAYRTKEFVKGGIFRYTSNGMYLYGFLILWLPGLFFGSMAALLVAAFNHLYIWVHYYTTELPDIKRMYEY
ncbi:MAG: hypothetical protein GPJ54_11730 [Candidatus Heimdallarchaeota archaeon]|nr:hypothetical protein [Candidatus Heimdallarchaeota archaeon]